MLVASGQTTELGEIKAHSPAEIHGKITIPGGASLGGIVISKGNASYSHGGRSQTTDTTGTFVFKGLAAGTHYLWVEEKEGLLVGGEPIEVELANGEIRELKLDLSDRVPCEIEVHVTFEGKPAEGVTVFFEATKQTREEEVGVTDAAGIVIAQVATGADRVLAVRSSLRFLAGTSDQPVTLSTGDRKRVDLAFHPGRLAISLSPAVAEAAISSKNGLLLLDRVGEENSQGFMVIKPSSLQEVDSRRIVDLGWVESGSYKLTILAGQQEFHAEVEVGARGETVCMLDE